MTKLLLSLVLLTGCGDASAEKSLPPASVQDEGQAEFICEQAIAGNYRSPHQFSIKVRNGSDLTCVR